VKRNCMRVTECGKEAGRRVQSLTNRHKKFHC
jgi:hypothetical protein